MQVLPCEQSVAGRGSCQFEAAIVTGNLLEIVRQPLEMKALSETEIAIVRLFRRDS
jgi:hypothetical protein